MESKQTLDIVDENGKMRFGRYTTPVQNTDLLRAEVYTGKTTPKIFKEARLKEWHAYQAGNADWFLFITAMNLKKLSVLSVMVYDRKLGKLHRFIKTKPLFRLELCKNLMSDGVFYSDEEMLLEIDHALERDHIQITGKVCSSANRPPISFTLTGKAEGYEPEIAVMPLPGNRGIYTHKHLMPMEGCMTIGERFVKFNSGESFFILDDQKAYYPHHMRWNWATGAAADGHSVRGFTLTENDSVDPDTYNENGFWKNGKFYALPAVTFELDNRNRWRIKDRDGKVDVKFHPIVENDMHGNWLVTRTDYSGPMGHFEGILISGEEELIVNGMFGMGEQVSLYG